MDFAEQKALVRRMLEGYRATNEITDQELRDSLPLLDTATALAQLEDVFNAAVAELPMRLTSGLVEQQAWFAKAHRR